MLAGLQAIASALATATSSGGRAAADAAAQALASGGSLSRKKCLCSIVLSSCSSDN